MAMDQSALLDLLAQLKLTDVTDRIRVATETLYQELIDAEATAFIGAGPFERTDGRTTHRNGTRARVLTTTAGELDLRIPKLRVGTFFPALLERRRRIDQALFAVVMEAYLHGVSTRKVDDLVKALAADTGISKSEVSRICAGLDAEVAQFRDRTLSALDYPYVFLDGVKLVMSDAHSGLKKAIGTVFQGASWQRCRVHFMRNVLSIVPKGSQDMVASIIRTVFAQPDREHIEKQFTEVATMLGRSHPKVAAMLDDAKPDLLAFAGFPQRHWRQIWSTNPVSVNKEIKRRTDVVGVFPNPAALLRLAGAVLVEQHNEWEAGDRRYFSESSMLELKTRNDPTTAVEEVTTLPELIAA